jgi:hypothetical protein
MVPAATKVGSIQVFDAGHLEHEAGMSNARSRHAVLFRWFVWLICEGERAVDDEASPFPRGFERGISGSERVHVAEDSMSLLAFW